VSLDGGHSSLERLGGSDLEHVGTGLGEQGPRLLEGGSGSVPGAFHTLVLVTVLIRFPGPDWRFTRDTLCP